MRSQRYIAAFAGVLVGFGLLTSARHVAAQADQGQILYLKFCSACHGASAKGNGVISESMRPRPTDLTQLAKQAGGTFQVADVAGRIDGREAARVHGNPDMPVWGEVLRSAPDEKEVSGKVLAITDYLRTIQAKSPAIPDSEKR